MILFCCQACRSNEEDHPNCYRRWWWAGSSHVPDHLSEICTSSNPNNRIWLYSEFHNVIQNRDIFSPLLVTLWEAWCIKNCCKWRRQICISIPCHHNMPFLLQLMKSSKLVFEKPRKFVCFLIGFCVINLRWTVVYFCCDYITSHYQICNRKILDVILYTQSLHAMVLMQEYFSFTFV